MEYIDQAGLIGMAEFASFLHPARVSDFFCYMCAVITLFIDFSDPLAMLAHVLMWGGLSITASDLVFVRPTSTPIYPLGG